MKITWPRLSLRELFTRANLRRAVTLTLAFSFVALIALAFWLFQLDQDIRTRLAEKRFAPPVEFYSSPEYVRPGAIYPVNYFEDLFTRKAYSKRDFTQSMAPGDVSIWTGDECRSFLGLADAAKPDAALDQFLNRQATPAPGSTPPPTISPSSITKCIAFVNRGNTSRPGEAPPPEPKGQVIALGDKGLAHPLAAPAAVLYIHVLAPSGALVEVGAQHLFSQDLMPTATANNSFTHQLCDLH